MLKNLPIGIQTFDKIINENYIYVDKTKIIYDLIRTGSIYFLSRPRRFGKSLLVSTLEQIFMGNKELFKGLAIYDQPFPWQQHPVIRISFGGIDFRQESSLQQVIKNKLYSIADAYDLTLKNESYYELFHELICKLSKINQVVILIDEYDQPIVDLIDHLELATNNRETLKVFYSVIKEADEYLRFVFLTGVTKFSKVSVFSGLNNLNDITMTNQFSALLGYTQNELEHYFCDYIDHVIAEKNITRDKALGDIKTWYNGYRFSENSESVYNPFSCLKFFFENKFENFWFETGTPTFFIKLIQSNNYDIVEIEEREFEKYAFDAYEIENVQATALLYQTGYLTIKDYDPNTEFYKLGYPNHEVRKSFSTYLLDGFSKVEKDSVGSYIHKLISALKIEDFEVFFDTLRIFFANIPYDLHLKNEKHYQTIFYLIFTLIGMRIEAEVKTNKGRVDAVMITDKIVYLFEFKLNGTAQEGIEQIKNNHYYEKYQSSGKTIKGVGVEFNWTEKNVGAWVSREIKQSTV